MKWKERPRWAGEAALLAAVAGAAIVARALHWTAARQEPLFSYLISDARAYWAWAEQIAAGDGLSRGQGVFYQAPLYPYFLAGIHWLGGASLFAVRVVQVGMGALGCALLAWSGTRLHSRTAGAVAGFGLAFFPVAIFADTRIQKESLGVFLVTVWFALAALAVSRPSRGRWIALGAVLGLLALVRENVLLLAPALAWWLHRFEPETPPAVRWRCTAGLAAGLVAVLAPVTVRNLWVGGEPVLITAQSGPNFFIGNHEGATGSYVPLRRGRSDTPLERQDAVAIAERAAGVPLSASAVSQYWWGQGLAFVARHPGEWLRLLAAKTRLFFHAHETPDAEDLYLYAEGDPWLRALLASGLHFGVLVPLAVAGALLGRARRREVALLVLWVVVAALAVIPFYVLGRYRFPALPPLLILAGVAVAEATRRARERDFRSAALPAALALGIAVPLNLPLATQRGEEGMRRLNRGAALAGLGRIEEAVTEYRRALRAQPDLAEAHMNLGSALLNQGQRAEGMAHLERARGMMPADPELNHLLGLARLEGGEAGPAEPLLRASVRAEPQRVAWRLDWTAALFQLGDHARGVSALRDGLASTAGDPRLAFRLVAALVSSPRVTSREIAEAIEVGERNGLAATGVDGMRLLAAAYLAADRRAEARALGERALTAASAAGNGAQIERIRGFLAAIPEDGSGPRPPGTASPKP